VKIAAVITGIGLVTPLGRTVDTTWQALLGGRGIVEHSRVDRGEFGGESRVSSLGIEAARQAIAEAKWGGGDEQTGVVCCTSKGPVEQWLETSGAAGGENESDQRENLLAAARRAGLLGGACNGASPFGRPLKGGGERSVAFGLGGFSCEVARRTGFTGGPRLTISAACASGLHGVIRAAMMIQTGQVSRVLVVAAEASVHPLFLASFNRLGVLAPAGDLCRPFDVNRNGFLMSDAAAAICLEAVGSAEISRGYAAIDRFAIGGDATHLTGSDPQGRVLRHLLGGAVGKQAMDLIHAHGTGTMANDSIELAAFASMRASGPAAAVFSHKGAIGHSLGASGLVAVAINCMSHRTGLIPPNINTLQPLRMDRMRIDREIVRQPVRRSVVHAAGFGGPAAVVSLCSHGAGGN
jgi:3-oxoacyl-[acyl-carrier-protein] synthase II